MTEETIRWKWLNGMSVYTAVVGDCIAIPFRRLLARESMA